MMQLHELHKESLMAHKHDNDSSLSCDYSKHPNWCLTSYEHKQHFHLFILQFTHNE